MVVKIVGAITGGLAFMAILAVLFGWLLAICWNHFPFLQSLHNMSAWDGIVMYVISSLLFKGYSNGD